MKATFIPPHGMKVAFMRFGKNAFTNCGEKFTSDQMNSQQPNLPRENP